MKPHLLAPPFSRWPCRCRHRRRLPPPLLPMDRRWWSAPNRSPNLIATARAAYDASSPKNPNVRKNGGELRIAVENLHGLCGGELEMTLDGQLIGAVAGIPLTASQHGVRVVIRPRGAVCHEPSRSKSFAAR